MKTIQVVKRNDKDDVYITASCIPKLEVGKMYEIKGSDTHDGIYLVIYASDSRYVSEVCENCPFHKAPANTWPYCSMHRRFKSGSSHPICIVNANRYLPRLVIRKLDNIMESL